MIKKSTFIKAMDDLAELSDELYRFKEALKKLSPCTKSFWLESPFRIVLNILGDIFCEEADSWIEYFVFERDFLRSIKLGDVLMNGEAVDLSDWGKVYDFLLENKQMKEDI